MGDDKEQSYMRGKKVPIKETPEIHAGEAGEANMAGTGSEGGGSNWRWTLRWMEASSWDVVHDIRVPEQLTTTEIEDKEGEKDRC